MFSDGNADTLGTFQAGEAWADHESDETGTGGVRPRLGHAPEPFGQFPPLKKAIASQVTLADEKGMVVEGKPLGAWLRISEADLGKSKVSKYLRDESDEEGEKIGPNATVQCGPVVAVLWGWATEGSSGSGHVN